MSGLLTLDEEVAARIRRNGPLPFDHVMDLALYDDERGFYAVGGAAGRRADFLTSPEVGPLFGAVLARALDHWWRELGEPDPFVVVEAGAGVGTLARSILEAGPDCAGALTYVLVEQSAALRARHGDHLPISTPGLALPPSPDDDGEPPAGSQGSGPRFTSLAELPKIGITGVVLTNELLDNLPFRLLERAEAGWVEIRIGLDGDGPALVEIPVPVAAEVVALADRLAPRAAPGARIPLQSAATDWVRRAIDVVERGRVVVIDYGRDTEAMANMAWTDWLRTYRTHARASGPLDDLGLQDITGDVALDQLPTPARRSQQRQSEFLRAFGLDELVAEGRRVWNERAAIGDLRALRARSRVGEAEALTDAHGLGAFWVIEWLVNDVT